MANLDLRKLSASLEALRPEVDAAYKRLDAKWKAVTDQLRSLPIPCNVQYTFDEDDYSPENYLALEWRKWNGSKRICIVSYYMESGPEGPEEASSTTPYEEWSGEQRVEMLQHIPKLFEAAVAQTKSFIERTKDKEERQ